MACAGLTRTRMSCRLCDVPSYVPSSAGVHTHVQGLVRDVGRAGVRRSPGGDAEGGGQGEGDAEPEEAAEEVALVAAGRLRRDGALPVGLVHEHRPEVACDHGRTPLWRVEVDDMIGKA